MTKDEKPTPETLENWHKNPNNWVLGIFYFNRNDKRIFPPKRIKSFGWTVNFANPVSIVSMLVVIAAIIVALRYFKSI